MKVSSKILRTEVLKTLRDKRLEMLRQVVLAKKAEKDYQRKVKEFTKKLVGRAIPRGAKITLGNSWSAKGNVSYVNITVESKYFKAGEFPVKEGEFNKEGYSGANLEEISKIIRLLEMSDEKYVSVRSFDNIYDYL